LKNDDEKTSSFFRRRRRLPTPTLSSMFCFRGAPSILTSTIEYWADTHPLAVNLLVAGLRRDSRSLSLDNVNLVGDRLLPEACFRRFPGLPVALFRCLLGFLVFLVDLVPAVVVGERF